MSEFKDTSFYFTLLRNGLNSEIDQDHAERSLEELGLGYSHLDYVITTEKVISFEQVANLINAVYDSDLVNNARKLIEVDDEKSQELDQLIRENEDLKFRYSVLNDKVSRLEEDRENLVSHTLRLESKNKSLNSDLEERSDINCEQEFNFNERERELKDQIQLLTERIDFLNNGVNRNLSLYESEVSKNSELSELLKVWSEEKSVLIKENDGLDKIITELKSEKEELTKGLSYLRECNLILLNNIDQFDDERKSLENQVIKLNKKNEFLVLKNYSLKISKREIQDQFSDREREVHTYRELTCELKENIVSLETKLNEEKEKYKRDTSLFGSEIGKRDFYINELETKIKELESNVSYLSNLYKLLLNEEKNRDHNYWAVQGIEKNERGDFELAIEFLNRAINLEDKKALYWNERGFAKKGIKKYEEAIIDLDKAIELDSSNPRYWSNRGFAKLELQKFDEALKDFEEAIKLSPNEARYWGNRGIANKNACNLEDAIKDFKKAIEFDKECYVYWSSLGDIKLDLANKKYSKNGNRTDYLNAIPDYNEALKLEPNSIWTLKQRGTAKFMTRDNNGAISDFNRILEIDEENQDAIELLKVVNREQENLEKEIEKYTQLIKQNPSDPRNWYQRGIYNEILNNDMNAFHDYDAACRLDQKDRNASNSKHRVFTKLKEKGENVSWITHPHHKPQEVRHTSMPVRRYKRQQIKETNLLKRCEYFLFGPPLEFESSYNSKNKKLQDTQSKPLKPTKVNSQGRLLLTGALLSVLAIEASLLGSYISSQYFDINPIEYAYEMKEKISNKIFD